MKKSGFSKVLLLAAALVLLLGFGTSVSAKDGYWYCSKKTTAKVNVEVGRSLSMARMLAAPRSDNYEEEYYDDEFDPKIDATWASSKKDVASIDKKTGELKTKKVGKTVITAVMEGKTYTCTMTVKKKGTLITGQYKKLDEAQKKLEKFKNKKINANNYKNILKAYNTFGEILAKINDKGYDDLGFLFNKPTNILVPITGADWQVRENLMAFANSKLEKAFAVQSVKKGSKAGELTIVLKKPVSGLQYWAFTFSNYDTDLYCYMNFSDKEQDNEDEYIDAVITFKKNSKYLKVKLTDEDGEPYKVRKGYYAELGLGISGQYLNVGTGSKRFLIK